jgi:hypothetical protein
MNLITLAQETVPADAVEPIIAPIINNPFSELSTISGVVAATLIVVEVIKRLFKSVPIIADAPVWLIAIVVSVLLTLLANQVFQSLQGDIWALAWSAALSAASASGFHTWLRKPLEGPAKASTAFAPLLAVVTMLAILPGCTTRQAALAKATTPIATQINMEMDEYIADLPPGAQKDEQAAKNAAYLASCQAGDRPTIIDTWYGGLTGQGIRLWYTGYLGADPKYEGPYGPDVLQMKMRNVNVFDYLLVVGEPPPP